jgi:hypothetical protein
MSTKARQPMPGFFVITSRKNQALEQFHHLQRFDSHTDAIKGPIIVV